MNRDNRTLTIERTLNAPIQLVWDAWTQPGHIAKWWGPKGMETRVEVHELKVGGAWKFSMKMPDGRDFIAEGVYKELSPPNKLVTSADFKPMTEGVTLEVILKAQGNQTHFTFNVVHPSEEYCRQQEAMGFKNGWGSTFDRLAELVEEES
ncbi:MAG: SRPBCC domain-containing protein [Flavobacteriaceae bacterium]